MTRSWMEAWKEHIQQWVSFQLQHRPVKPSKTIPQETEMLRRFKRTLERRQADLLKIRITCHPYRLQRFEKQEHIYYQLRLRRMLKINGRYHMEEQWIPRIMKSHDGYVIIDQEQPQPMQIKPRAGQPIYPERHSFMYDRRKAVQYAEAWWNNYNPDYQAFSDNCTNFISQCLRAGDAPMRGQPDRGSGWWYSGTNWSYSWAVAHSFRWYLSSSDSGLTAVETEKPEKLGLGDVICYDFNGDDNWQHSTIVTGFDGNGEPLVNAQTSNSRSRYWTYEDSTAWTPAIRYKFFQIGQG
ncbi:amidase domain-containing protein [Salibacterium halotolerans]|uniref:Putative amidase domain-containing protein n=1 Tax=Salibacterium halotolerans TaxID=1884432 RepID=A0A1I5UJV2_9BACI|nr:amidase domain-containing protein [Salibacterium halotolerans]SFP95554.1 Putative amidase domain-containing protein [Salibacterium halotolerans]